MTNLDKLEKIFPECITEARDDDGKICRAVNFERLKQILSGERAAGKEAYEFNFVGKKNAELEAHRPTDKTLRPALDESRDFNATENLYVEGDNLEALKILEESYLGKVKMIYIDPPYNTGNDFIYRDDFAQNADDFDAAAGNLDAHGNRLNLQLNRESRGRFHSDWCAMIFSRLLLAKNFLSDDGVIFISIDDHEQANLKKICDEVFGEKNFRNTIMVRRRIKSLNSQFSDRGLYSLNVGVESILVYSKSNEFLMRAIHAEKLNAPQKGRWDVFWSNANRPTMRYEILGFTPATGQWRNSKAKADVAVENYRVYLEKYSDEMTLEEYYKRTGISEFIRRIPNATGKNGGVQHWIAPSSTALRTSNWLDMEVSQIAKEIDLPFDNPKNKNLIMELVRLAGAGEDSIVMDFFSGSATTAHAVMELNATDGGHRKFIMIQIGDETPANSEARRAGYEKISDIGKERIRRAGDKLKGEHPALDTGFRVFKVSTSNFKPLPTDLQTLLTFVDNIEPDRNEYDLFFGTLLSKGMTLDKKFAAEEVDGFKVLSADGGEILACFDEKISAATFRKLAERKPRKIFFRDSSFASSADKINALEFIKNFAPDTEVTVL